MLKSRKAASDSGKGKDKAEMLEAFNKNEQRIFHRGKIIFWFLTVFGIIAGIGTLAFSVLQISAASETIVNDYEQNGAAGFLIMLLGAALIAACYLLTKGISAARAAYSVLAGIESLLILGVLMTGDRDVVGYAPFAGLLAVIFILLAAACVLMVCTRGVKEYMYEREIICSDIDK